MAQILCVRLNWNHTAIPLGMSKAFYSLEINPETAYPFGRKGLALTSAWQQLETSDIAGMLLLDGDVAIDPLDHMHMLDAIDHDSTIIHTAPVYLWPVSTHVAQWVWGFGQNGRYSQRDYGGENLDTFTFCYTFLPRKLISAAIEAGMAEWQYPKVDKSMCKLSKKLGIAINVVWEADAKHLNY